MDCNSNQPAYFKLAFIKQHSSKVSNFNYTKYLVYNFAIDD